MTLITLYDWLNCVTCCQIRVIAADRLCGGPGGTNRCTSEREGADLRRTRGPMCHTVSTREDCRVGEEDSTRRVSKIPLQKSMNYTGVATCGCIEQLP